MKETLIHFNTAKLAKEKGFEIKTSIYPLGTGDTSNSCNHTEEHYPTQSLLQKWLRDEHDLFVLIYYANDSWGYMLKKDPEDYGFDSYEEALENGLQQTLKLIKNVK